MPKTRKVKNRARKVKNRAPSADQGFAEIQRGAITEQGYLEKTEQGYLEKVEPSNRFRTNIDIQIPYGHQRVACIKWLNIQHGWKKGWAPLKVKSTKAHQDATYGLLRVARLSVEIEIDKFANKKIISIVVDKSSHSIF